MYRTTIVGHDLHEGGSDALALGRLIAGASRGQLIAAGVVPIGVLPRGLGARWREPQERIAAAIQSVADEAGAKAETLPSSSPARGLQGLAEVIHADLIVVGSSRHGRIRQILAGNVGLGLLHGSPCAVAVAPSGYRHRATGAFDRVTLGFDGSYESGLAFLGAIDLARASGAGLHLVAVATPPPVRYAKGGGRSGGYRDVKEAVEEPLREQLDEAVRSVPADVSAEGTVVSGDPAQLLVDATGERGVLVVGSRAHGPLRRVLLGSISSVLVRSARCPLVVHPCGSAGSSDS